MKTMLKVTNKIEIYAKQATDDDDEGLAVNTVRTNACESGKVTNYKNYYIDSSDPRSYEDIVKDQLQMM